MKNQALFSSKDNSKKLKCRLLQFLFGALRVNYKTIFQAYIIHLMVYFFEVPQICFKDLNGILL